MKKLQKSLLALALLSGVVYAKDKVYLSQQVSSEQRYMLDITSDKELKQGENLLKVNLKHQEHNIVNANVKLILENNNKEVLYEFTKVDDLGNYIFPVNLSKQGVYNYTVVFNRVGEVVRNFRGNIELN